MRRSRRLPIETLARTTTFLGECGAVVAGRMVLREAYGLKRLRRCRQCGEILTSLSLHGEVAWPVQQIL